MLPAWLVILISFGYLGLLFAIASFGDRRADQDRSVINSPYIYALSLAVYCTAWTFYGSVGLAAERGVAFLPVYIGPTLVALLFPFVLHKILRIAKVCGITSIADFIAARYGKSALLGGIVTLVAVIGAIPYISLQLKALSSSVTIVLGSGGDLTAQATAPGRDTAFTITLILAAFSILFGARHIDATETHQGMVLAIAFESIVKLVAFLAIGIYATFVLFDGFGDLAARAVDAGHGEVLTMAGTGLSYGDWFLVTAVSGFAIIVLPRQFQIAVIENTDDRHLEKATWLFPLYLLLINVFVLPIALAGILVGTREVDLIILEIPMIMQQPVMVAVVYLGGLSAATAMIIVTTVALSTMISNDLVVPVLLRLGIVRAGGLGDLSRLILMIRRAAMLVLLIMGYGFFRLVPTGYGLVSIGLISFVGAAQFAPAIIAALYWREATKLGAITGILGGFLVWFYSLIVPTLAQAGFIGHDILAWVPFAHDVVRPQALFGVDGSGPIGHALVWSLSVNVLLLVLGTLLGRQSPLERIQALLYVEVYDREGATRFWRGDARVAQLRELMIRFLGPEQADRVLAHDALERGQALAHDQPADAKFVQRVERHLARAIGAASARVMVASIVPGEVIGPDELMEIFDETSQVIEYSQRLEQKSRALEQATAELETANQRLTELDRLKDDFIATVSHELRTPLTSIRAFSEILLETPVLSPEERREFLLIVVRESQRLTRLIDDLLDISRIESGGMEWHVVDADLVEIVNEAVDATRGLCTEKGIALERRLPPEGAPVRCDRDRLVQVVVNLLANAVKFVPAAGGHVRCVLETGSRAHMVRVEDDGPGVPEAERQAVFEKFHQVGESLKNRAKGTGLGLAISEHIVRAFDGQIWVEDSELGGAAVCFTLPAAASAMRGAK